MATAEKVKARFQISVAESNAKAAEAAQLLILAVTPGVIFQAAFHQLRNPAKLLFRYFFTSTDPGTAFHHQRRHIGHAAHIFQIWSAKGAGGMPRKQAYEFAAQAVLGSARMVLALWYTSETE